MLDLTCPNVTWPDLTQLVLTSLHFTLLPLIYPDPRSRHSATLGPTVGDRESVRLNHLYGLLYYRTSSPRKVSHLCFSLSFHSALHLFFSRIFYSIAFYSFFCGLQTKSLMRFSTASLLLLWCTSNHTSSLISILLSPISLLFSPYSSYSHHTRTCTYSVENLSGPTSPSGIKPEDLTDDIFSFIFLAKPLPEGVSTNIPTALLQSMQEVPTIALCCDCFF